MTTGQPSSLALYRESVPTLDPEKPLSRCPRKLEFVMYNVTSGNIAPARCKTNGCAYCGPVNARLIAGAIALAAPSRALLLTSVGDHFPTIRNRVKKFTYRLRKEVPQSEMVWHIEPNPQGTGHHLHGWQRGDFIPQHRLSALSDGSGMGSVAFISQIRQKDPMKLGYGLKLAGVGYGLKLSQAEATMGEYLEANGKRLVHATRGFWQVDGHKTGQREAMAEWSRRWGNDNGETGQWQLVRLDQLRSVLGG